MTRSPIFLRGAAAESTLRPYDLAEQLGVPEAALVAARTGHGNTRIDPAPDRLIPMVEALGEVMALTRNRSCVIEKIGHYRDFHSGKHAAMTLDPEIDLRLFPRHWVHGFAVEQAGEEGPRRSIQVFDAAGDAVHKIHLLPASDLAAWDALREELASEDQSDTGTYVPREPVQPPRGASEKGEALREQWERMTDTHQFLPMVRRLDMNRLGAYRVAGSPLVRPLVPAGLAELLGRLQQSGMPAMVFVGNLGCIEIHSGPIGSLKPTGPWLNVMDPRFNLHLRADRVAEWWEVRKPGEHGQAISVEAFDAEGELILQVFGIRPSKGGDPAAWAGMIEALPGVAQVAA